METIFITILDNVKIGDTLTFPSRKYNGKPVKRKLYSMEFCTINEDNIHHRLEYRVGKNIYSPVIEKVLALNPSITANTIEVEVKEGTKRGVFNGSETDIHYHYFEHNGVECQFGRYWIVNGNKVWFLNNY